MRRCLARIISTKGTCKRLSRNPFQWNFKEFISFFEMINDLGYLPSGFRSSMSFSVSTLRLERSGMEYRKEIKEMTEVRVLAYTIIMHWSREMESAWYWMHRPCKMNFT